MTGWPGREPRDRIERSPGDPSLSPFRATPCPGETLQIRRAQGGFEVVLDWAEGFHYREWDMFGTNRQRDYRMFERIRVDDLLPEGTTFKVEVTVEAQ